MTNLNPSFKSARLALVLGFALTVVAGPALARGGSGGEAGGGDSTQVMKPYCLQPTKAGGQGKTKQKAGNQSQVTISCR